MQVANPITKCGSVPPNVAPIHDRGTRAVGRMEVYFAAPMDRTSGIGCGSGSRTFLYCKTKKAQSLEWKRPLSSGHMQNQTKLGKPSFSRGLQFPGVARKHRNFTCPKSAMRQGLERTCFVSARKCLDAPEELICSFESDHDQNSQVLVEESSKKSNRSLASTLTAIAGSLLILAAPAPKVADSAVTFCDSARADQIGQLRLLEKAAEGLSKVGAQEVLDKIVTVVTGVSGITYVDPEKLDQEVDGLLSGQKDVKEDVLNGIKSAIESSWSTIFDLVTNFNPISFYESAGSTVSAFLESGAERVAAFELTTLFSIGERYIILAPLFAIPMAWEMRRLKARSEREAKGKSDESGDQSAQAQLRSEKVRRELERIELRKLILDAVESLGKSALQPPRTKAEAGMIRRRITDLLQRLEELSPVEDKRLLVPDIASSISSQKAPNDALAYVPSTPTVDGDWDLIYVSEAADSGGFQDPSFFPGVGLDKLRQHIWQEEHKESTIEETDMPLPSSLLTRNTAEFRLGPLGVFQLAVHGSWENLEYNQRAQVLFNQFSARPLEILGNRLSEDIPELKLTLPMELQRSAEWGVAYVDDQLRISRGSRGQIFLFRKDNGIPVGT